jgi:hypothetical protein
LVDFVQRHKSIGMGWDDTPKISGQHRRCGRPFGELSPFHSAVAVALLLVVFGFFVTLLGMMNR